jgi:hypothetical protein
VRSKGNKAEREVAALLQGWWRQLEPEALFVRTPLSGGWVQGRDIFQARGDLMVKGAPRFPWLVEVKRREQGALLNFELGRRHPAWGWWERTSADAALAGRTPMLWFRRNQQEWIVVVPALLGRAIPRMADFAWENALPFDPEFNVPHPRAFWADKFLGTHPRRWL